MSKLTVYYAHSTALYNTPQETRDIQALSTLGFEIVNPNSPKHEAGYKKDGMEYFIRIVETCAAIAFRANPDGSMNAGVHSEVMTAKALGKPILELPCGLKSRGLTIDQTRAYLEEQGSR